MAGGALVCAAVALGGVVMGMAFSWAILELAARDKLGLGDEYELYAAEVLPHNAPRDAPCVFHVNLGVPRLLTRGPNKGQKRWDGDRQEQWLGEAEVEAQARRYEAETGKCCACTGTGKQVARWSVTDGTTYRDCGRCHGTGNQP